MACDRNLFTLSLVLNQTQGEWRWQAAMEGHEGDKRGGSGGVSLVTLSTTPHTPREMAITKAPGSDGREEEWVRDG